jgi:hypothetical protein
MNKDEALKLALEYLKQRELAWNVQIALKEALAAQQEHEPENEPFVSLASVQEPQRYSPDGEGGMELDSLGAYVKLQDVPAPPAAQRQWVGLTDEEYFEIGQRHWVSSRKIELIHAEIEAKLKEKNT